MLDVLDTLEWISMLVFTPFVCAAIYLVFVSVQDHYRRKALTTGAERPKVAPGETKSAEQPQG
jgi:hypothetical protein